MSQSKVGPGKPAMCCLKSIKMNFRWCGLFQDAPKALGTEKLKIIIMGTFPSEMMKDSSLIK